MRKLFTTILILALSLTAMAKTKPGENTLSLDIDAELFLVNNEFTTLMKGYTLPGFRFTPTLTYTPIKGIKLQGGVYMLRYWGANEYPNGNYLGIPEYSAEGNSKGLHALPFLRAEATAPCGITFVMGNIYGGRSHKLMPQLYAPELALTADPETGFQMLFQRPWADFDLWVDWRTFIYNNSPYRENFFVGLSSSFRYNSPDAPVHVFSPLQALVEHRGGEIDTDEEPGVNTMMNAATGVGLRVNTNRKALKYIQFQGDILASYQQAGEAWAYGKGLAWMVHADADIYGLQTTLGYYSAHKFMPVLGLPLWGVASTKYPGMLLQDPQTVYLGLSYQYTFAPGFSMSADLQVYQLLECDKIILGYPAPGSSTTSFAFGVTFRATPSFLLKKFKKK